MNGTAARVPPYPTVQQLWPSTARENPVTQTLWSSLYLFGECTAHGRRPLRPNAASQLLVHGCHSGAQVLALLRAGRVNACGTAGTQGGQGLVVLGVGNGVAIGQRIAHGLAQQLLVACRQALPKALVYYHRVAQVAMLGEAQIGLHLVHLLGPKIRDGVFRVIHHAAGQGLAGFAKCQRDRLRTQGTHLLGNDS